MINKDKGDISGHKLNFYNFFIFANKCRRLGIFQTINSLRSKNLSLKYPKSTSFVCKDIVIRKF